MANGQASNLKEQELAVEKTEKEYPAEENIDAA